MLPSNIDGDKYERKRTRDLRRGDIVPVEQISTGKLIERQISSVETIAPLGTGRSRRIGVRYDNGAFESLDPLSRTYYREEP